MSNQLLLSVGTFNVGGSDKEPEWGFTIEDNYAMNFSFSWESEKEFYTEFPTPASLWNRALEKEGFSDFAVKRDMDGLPVMDEFDCPLAAEIWMTNSFELCGYDKEKAAEVAQKNT